ncbi:hypothetical protein EMCRGX_G026206 [Ephydatia muelleri]
MNYSRPHLSTSSGIDKRLPVFVFPEELSFLASDESSHKQVLTLYNPYDFTVQYHVMCNAPQKYSVVEAKGNIDAHSCVDVVVRHKQAGDGPFDVTDKFRLDIYADGKLVGRKQIPSLLSSSAPKDAPEQKSQGRNPIYQEARQQEDSCIPSQLLTTNTTQVHRGQQTPAILLLVLASFCVAVLFLPLEGTPTSLPEYLYISVNQKLIVAFVLGMLTMAILRS